MTTPQPRPLRTAAHIKTLKIRLATQKAEAAECATKAAYDCVMESVRDTERQLREAQTAA